MLGFSPTAISVLKAVNKNEIGNGACTLSYADGQVISVQPGGAVDKRPVGTAGPYEICTLSGNDTLAFYAPEGADGDIYAFLIAPGIPNV